MLLSEGKSFTGAANSLHASADMIWQLVEQGAGGLITAYVFSYIEEREMHFG